MPGCSVLGCTNSAAKGYLMKLFPRDPVRRQEWVVNLNRDGWCPTDNSCICEVHFAPEMWERTRVDGKRKLRSCAVPTILSLPASKKRRATTLRRVMCAILPNNTEDALSSKTKPQPSSSRATSPSEITTPQSSSICDDSENNSSVDLTPQEMTHADLAIKLCRCRRAYLKEWKMAKQYKRVLRNLEQKLKRNQYRLLKQLFTNDQIFALRKRQQRRKTEFTEWSKSTIAKAIKLKTSCGRHGYEELLRQGYPLPSIHTLKKNSMHCM